MKLQWGQISPTNYKWLTSYYGGPPPWSMDRSPHMSLVRAVLESTDPLKTDYFEYLRASHERPMPDLVRQFGVVSSLLDAHRYEVAVEAGCVVDGNYRHAVATLTGKPIEIDERQPYQTICTPKGMIDGRRLHGRIPADVDLHGETVLDVGTAQGANAILAAQRGAKHVYGIDLRMTSQPWRLRREWDLDDKITWIPADAQTFTVPADVTMVFALSVRAYINPERFAELLRGRRVLLETQNESETPPTTGHAWKPIGSVPYSRETPHRLRTLYLGTP